MTEEMKKARKLVAEARKILVFTGPGLSAASGLPCSGDIRPSKSYVQGNCSSALYVPVSYQQFVDSTRHKLEHWKFLYSSYPLYKAARPNAAHEVLVSFEKKGRLLAVVTQNEDNLHRLAGTGTDCLIELHGTWLYAECLDCFDWIPMDEVFENFAKDGFPPLCHCGGWLKPAPLMKGEELEREFLIKAFKAARDCDLVISAGSSLRAEPSSSVPLAAKAAGKPYIIINAGTTAHDRAADIILNGDAGQLLPELLS
ncbi:MAG: NAD-dependent deacetylase [Elusimicrobiales bacterium]|nr:NAD-dependent deacetylase [Elusimicrobiales bacterium]